MKDELDRLLGAVQNMSSLPDEHKKAIKGKLYTEVHVRVQAFREAYGEDGKIISAIHIADDVKVMTETTVSVFVGKSWRVIGNDFAEEFRGDGPVNASSAVENCLTSSIGRALSNCGLLGGPYASFDEVSHAVTNKPKAPQPEAAAAPEPEPEPEPEVQVKKKNIDDFTFDTKKIESEEAAEDLTKLILEMAAEFSETVSELREFWAKNADTVSLLAEKWPEQSNMLLEGFKKLKSSLPEIAGEIGDEGFLPENVEEAERWAQMTVQFIDSECDATDELNALWETDKETIAHVENNYPAAYKTLKAGFKKKYAQLENTEERKNGE